MSDIIGAQQLTRGGETVGLLSNLSKWEVELVLNFRYWVDDDMRRNNIRCSFSKTSPSDQAKEELLAFERFLETIAENSYYPLAHHDPEYPCLGAHEAVLTRMVRLAYSGLLLEAMQMASLIALPSRAELISLMAIRVGHAMRQIALTHSTYEVSPRSESHRLH